MQTEIRVVLSGGRVDSIEVTEKKPAKRKSAEVELREMLKPMLVEGNKECD